MLQIPSMQSSRDTQSVVETSIGMALDDLEWIIREAKEASLSYVVKVKFELGVMKTLHLCRKMWGEDRDRAEPALRVMEDIILKRCQEIHSFYLRLRQDEEWEMLLVYEYSDSLYEIGEAMKQGMEVPFEILSDVFLLQTSSSAHHHFEMVDLLNIIDSLLYIVPLLPKRSFSSSLHPPGVIAPTIRFLKNFILLGSSFQGLVHRQLEDLFIHIEHSVVNFTCLIIEYVLSSSDQQFDFHESMRRIEPFDPHVCGIYVGVLQEILELSPASIQHHTPESRTLVLKDFVDSLLFLLLKLLFCGPTSHWYTFDHRIRKLYKGLELMKTTLREHHGKDGHWYEKRQDIVCEAGTIIFYLFIEKEDGGGMVEKLELLFSASEEKIKLIKGSEEEPPRHSLASASSCFPQTNLQGFIDSLLEKINSVNVYEANSIIVSGKDKFQTIRNDLAALRYFLVDVMQKCNQIEQLKAPWGRIAALAYETEFALDTLLVERDLQSFVILLHTIVEEIELIKVEASECSQGEGKMFKSQDVTKSHSKLPSIGKLPEVNEHVVGLDEETRNIVDQLTRGTKQLDIVSIVGMAGLGKTTLANKVYRHHSIVHRFYIRSWCTISQIYNKKNLLLEILRGLDDESANKYLEMNEHDLALKLYQSLKGKTYLIVLDDVWDASAWSDLQTSFPDDNKGSRILLTSRHENVAMKIKLQSDPLRLHLLTDDESWELFQMKVGFPSELHDSEKAIVKHCKGLPLMIVVIAGLLSNMEPSSWGGVEESLDNGKDQCIDAIAMSYSHLPPHLKLCFLYFAAYAEDQKISVRKMIWLWIAEGFVEKNERDSIEDVAEGYLMELIQRNLVMVAGKEFGNRVKFCMLHDLIHEFCLKKANEEHFLYGLHGSDIGNSIEKYILYRLRVCSGRVEDFVESRMHCPRLRTLIFLTDYKEKLPFLPPWYDILYKFCQSNFLGVLDLTGVFKFKSFPLVILLLVRLRYLALSTGDQWEIPSSIEHLSNLETFIVQGDDVRVFLPNTIWNLKKLRHLCRSSQPKGNGWPWELSIENPECLSYLENLQVFSNIEFSGHQTMKEVIRKSPNIRILKCYLSLRDDETKGAEDFKIIALDCLSQLESLWLKDLFQVKLDLHFQLPQSLKKLTLIGFGLPWSRITTVDRLSNLEVLKLVEEAFEGEDWDMEGEEEGTFPKLRFLKLKGLNLARWTGSDDNFACLEKLVLEDCNELIELPSCLATSSTLEIIEVTNCKHAADSVKEIQEMQKDLGNEHLKILIKH